MSADNPGSWYGTYSNNTGPWVPNGGNTGDNAWQLTAATLVGLQSVPGLVVLYVFPTRYYTLK